MLPVCLAIVCVCVYACVMLCVCSNVLLASCELWHKGTCTSMGRPFPAQMTDMHMCGGGVKSNGAKLRDSGRPKAVETGYLLWEPGSIWCALAPLPEAVQRGVE